MSADLEGERERAIGVLTKAFAKDLLSIEEYETRVGRVQAAASGREIGELLVALPAFAPDASAVDALQIPAGEERIVLSGSTRRIGGAVLRSPRLVLELAHSSLKLDYGGLELPPGVYHLDLRAIHSSCTITLPLGALIENRLNLQYSNVGEPRHHGDDPDSGIVFRLTGDLLHSVLRLRRSARPRLGLFGRRR